MADDIEQFIVDQKNRLARERQELQNQSTDKIYQDVQNGSDTHHSHEGGQHEDGAGLSSLGGHEDTKVQLRKERQEEYARYLEGKEARSGRSGKVPERDWMSLPIGDRGSAKNRAEHQRNIEYQAFIKEKDAQEKQRREHRMGRKDQAVNGSPRRPTKDVSPASSQDRLVKKEAASQTPNPPPEYDEARPPRPPRRGWGSPSPDYDEMLRRRREEEARYRQRYDDLDYYPVRMSMRPSRSDPRLDRRAEEDGHYSRLRDSEDRRRVRFTDLEDPAREHTYASDRLHPPPPHREKAQNGYGSDHYGVTRSNTLPEMERSSPVPKPSPRAKSATSAKDDDGFVIGKRETNSAIHRRKELYRKELAQQIQEQKNAKKRERERERAEELRLVSENAPEATRSGRGSAPPASHQTGQLSIHPPPVQAPLYPGPHHGPPHGYTPSFAGQPYPSTSTGRVPDYPNQYSANRAAIPASTMPADPVRGSFQHPPVPNLRLAETLDRPPPPPPEPVGSLGLEEAYLRSGTSMLNRPFNLTSNTADPYNYYTLRNPMEPDPNYAAGHQLATFQPSPSNIPRPGQVPLNANGIPAAHPQQQSVQYNEVVNTSGLRSESAIRNYVGDANLSPRALKDPKSYQQQLLLQMQEKEKKKLQDRQAQARFEAKLEAEAQVYNPWGKGGGGAPMRNAQGQVFADLKQLHKLNEQVLQDPSKPVSLYANAPTQDAPNAAATAVAPTGLARAMTERGMSLGPSDQGPVGPGVQETLPAQGNPTDVYKAQLMQQVEDKRRREAEEKEKIKQEEERETRRLEEQRERMKREFEQEKEAKKKKEEEKQRQQDELQAKIEEKRKEAEEMKRGRRRVEQPVTTVTVDQSAHQRQVTSPPVPALAKNQENMDRLKSPPIPTLQKKMAERLPEQRTPTPRQSTPRHVPSQSPRTTPKQMSRRNRDDSVQGTKRHSYPVRGRNARAEEPVREASRASSLDQDRIFSPRYQPATQSLTQPATQSPTHSDTGSPPQSPNVYATNVAIPSSPNRYTGRSHDRGQVTGFDQSEAWTPTAIDDPEVTVNDLGGVTESPEPPIRLLTPLVRLRERYLRQWETAVAMHGRPQKSTAALKAFDLVDWLCAIDPELVVYAPRLAASGYASEQALCRLNWGSLLDACPGIKRGHAEAVIHRVERMQTPDPLGQKTLSGRGSTPATGPFFDEESIIGELDFSDDEIPDTTRSVSPPVPAVSNRERDGGDERDVISALSAMRRQLQSEQRRVQSQLDKHQEYNKYASTKPPAVSRHVSPQVDVFEVARHKGGGVSVRREPINHQAAKDFKNLKGGRTQSQQKLLDQFPSDPQSDLALEAQQRALLRHQQSRLQEMKQDSRNKELNSANMEALGRKSQSPALILESSSAFIGIENGETQDLPKGHYTPDTKTAPGPSKPTDPFGSVTSFDSAMLERLAEKNKARNELLKSLEPDSDSLADADDILNQFLAKQSMGSPMLRSASRKSEDLSLWLKPSEG